MNQQSIIIVTIFVIGVVVVIIIMHFYYYCYYCLYVLLNCLIVQSLDVGCRGQTSRGTNFNLNQRILPSDSGLNDLKNRFIIVLQVLYYYYRSDCLKN